MQSRFLNKTETLISRLKNIIYVLLPAGIAFYIIYPLLSGVYFYHNPEYQLYKSFMVNFLDTLKKGELPTWNEYVGGGHPAMYFGHYPISQNTILYMLFGFGDFTCYLAKCLNLIILFFGFIWVCKYLQFNYLIALIGVLTYFSINLVCRFFIADTVGNLFFIYPLLMIMIIKIVDENKPKDILLFSLFYILWLSGGHITYVYMHVAMLSIVYWITIFIFCELETFKLINLKKFLKLYFVLFMFPFLAVLYQYYFVYDILSTSNRFPEGLIVSPYESTAWKQLLVSFQSSSYVWVGLFLALIYAGLRLLIIKYSFIETKKIKIPLWLLLIPLFLYGVISIVHGVNLGKNIVVNGGFSVDTQGWCHHLSTLASVPGGQSGNCIQITTTEDTTGGYAYSAVHTSVGEMYKFTAYFKRGTAADGQIMVGTKINTNDLYYSGVLSDTNWTQYNTVFKATTPTVYITLVNLGSIKGLTSFFDTVTLSEEETNLLELAVPVIVPDFFGDYAPILRSEIFWVALLLYVLVNYFILYKEGSTLAICLSSLLNLIFILVAYISLLSYYFYSPANILGYDYDFFRELSVPFQIIFTFLVLYSLKNFQQNRIIKIIVLSSIVLYLIRSHFTIPLLRFTGIIWYSVRDGSVFSVFFGILFMFGLKNIISDFSHLFKRRGDSFFKCIHYGLLVFLLVLLVRDSFNKVYKGTSNKLIRPNQIEIADTPVDKLILEKRKEHTLLNDKLLELNEGTKHFYRICTPELFTNEVLPGQLQQYKIYEAGMYESSIQRELKDFFDYIILGKIPVKNNIELKDLMQCGVFTRHVHVGLNVYHHEVSYSHLFTLVYFPDMQYIKDKNIKFFWDIMQVKYFIIGSEFSKVLEGFANREYFKLLCNYPKLDLNLYEIVKNKSYSKLAIVSLDKTQSFDEAIKELNSTDIETLRTLYSKLVFLDRDTEDFALARNQSSESTRHYEIFSKQDAILVDLESWNRNWELMVNNKNEKLQKAFHMFKGIRLQPGLNQIDLTYNLKYFKELFILSILVIVAYLFLWGKIYYAEYNNKKAGKTFGGR